MSGDKRQPNRLEELVEYLREELNAMTDLHDRKHRDWQASEAENERLREFVMRVATSAPDVVVEEFAIEATQLLLSRTEGKP